MELLLPVGGVATGASVATCIGTTDSCDGVFLATLLISIITKLYITVQ